MKRLLYLLSVAAATLLVACEPTPDSVEPNTTIASLGTPSNNEIWFTTVDGRELASLNEEAFDVAIQEVIYSEFDTNIIRFAKPVTEVGNDAFRNCHNLFNISLPSSVKSIGERAFFECINLECLTLGEGLQRCGEMAFDNCINLHSLHIPSIVSWCHITFATPTANPLYFAQRFVIDGEKISSLHIPNSITSINPYAFIGNALLLEVTIPASLSRVGKSAFEECGALRKVHISSLKAWCNIDFENETANPVSLAQALYIDGYAATTLSLDGIECIKSRAFINCTSVTDISTYKSLRSIELEAFRNCTSLKKVLLEEGIREIGARAFMGCSSLSNVTLFASKPPVLGDDYVFTYNHNNRKIYVPNNAVQAYKTDEMWSQYADSINSL